jgi:hypothetical protein
MNFDLEQLSDGDVAALVDALQAAAAGAMNRQAVADAVVGTLYDCLRMSGPDERACVLARYFQTVFYARLPMDYQHVADVLLEQIPSHKNMRCLSLLATRGAKRLWNDPATSTGHQCIPLPSVETVKRAPMIARLLEDFGVSVESLVAFEDENEGVIASTAEDGLAIFHVGQALGSPFVPAQTEFVQPQGVRSVVAMGGLLADGDLFAVILFTRVAVSAEVAARLRTLAVAVRDAMLPFAAKDTFALHD